MENKQLVVSTMKQKIAFLCEMAGQISDGHWENASPLNHYRAWSGLNWDNVVVCPNELQGRNFPAERDNYNFANKGLLDIVGERMLIKIKLARLDPGVILPILAINHFLIPESLENWDWEARQEGEYWENKQQQRAKMGLTYSLFVAAVDSDRYTMKDLRKDLKELKQIVRIRI